MTSVTPSTSNTITVTDNSDNILEDYELVIDGIGQWLNNEPKKSEEFFKSNSDRTPILAGYAFVLCMNGVISYEMDKIDEAQKALRILEKRCTSTTTVRGTTSNVHQNWLLANGFNWLSNVRYKIFGNITSLNVDTTTCTKSKLSNNMENTKNNNLIPIEKATAQLIEEQIILADAYMSLAILTFLTQDITGLMKGSWLLRKAWKIYQRTYTQLYELYVERFGNEDDANYRPPTPSLNYSSASRLRLNMPRSVSHFNWTTQTSVSNESTTSIRKPNENLPPININELNNIDKSDTSSVNIQVAKKSLQLNFQSPQLHQYPKSCTTESLTPNTFQQFSCNEIESNTLKRLMGAAAFGYGIFQLTSSLLPNKLLKIISIFGFEGNRDIGIACLMFTRKSSDMRAVLATLSLLWFYTFGTQIFRNEDGYANDKMESVANLLEENETKYKNSAIFLFFHGRLERMKGKADTAVDYFEKSYRLSAQSELKLLCLHEIAWCKLIQLNFVSAQKYFNELRLVSVYSKAFYTYMTAICEGALHNFDNLIEYKEEICRLLRRPGQKQTQILTLLENRVHKFPSDYNDSTNELYWKYLCYEMLYLWGVFSSIRNDQLTFLIEECSRPLSGTLIEPMLGLRDLLIGSAEAAKKNYDESIAAYSRCIDHRKNIVDVSMHISAFAHFDLALILLHCFPRDTQQVHIARKLLLNAQKFQNYDLENRLCVQIQQELKKLTR